MLGMMRMECKGGAVSQPGLVYTGSTTAFLRALTHGLTLCAGVRRHRIINIYRFICSSASSVGKGAQSTTVPP